MNRLMLFVAVLIVSTNPIVAQGPHSAYSVRQLTHGSQHHFFGYIGHVGTVPWNSTGRYVLALRTPFHDHMPAAHEPAEILLLDSKHRYRPRVVATTHGWNLQQGAMLYWNPKNPATQFFFNDRDPDSGEVFTVLHDIEAGRRIREFRFTSSPIANSGVAQTGGWFCAINYGRLARLRLVTGLAGAEDWSAEVNAPVDDGIFKVDVATGARSLLVSYRQMRDAIGNQFANLDEYPLFVNHTLCNRAGDRVYFFCRANFRSRLPKVDIPMTVNSDGSGLSVHMYVGGHPEWDHDGMLIGSDGKRQVRYDTTRRTVVNAIGDEHTFEEPGGDIALSPNGRWLVNGHKRKDLKQVFFTLFDRQTNRAIRTKGFSIGDYLSGPLRIDPAPCWNRRGSQILFSAYDKSNGTRQLFLMTIQ